MVRQVLMTKHLLNLIFLSIQLFLWARSIFSMVIWVLPWHCVKDSSWRFLGGEKDQTFVLQLVRSTALAGRTLKTVGWSEIGTRSMVFQTFDCRRLVRILTRGQLFGLKISVLFGDGFEQWRNKEEHIIEFWHRTIVGMCKDSDSSHGLLMFNAVDG